MGLPRGPVGWGAQCGGSARRNLCGGHGPSAKALATVTYDRMVIGPSERPNRGARPVEGGPALDLELAWKVWGKTGPVLARVGPPPAKVNRPICALENAKTEALQELPADNGPCGTSFEL